MKKNILYFFLLLSFLGWSQDVDTSAESPKVGLVLSGGGAKGLAHIGVLKVLDSLNVKVDYIAGTSMGAIVGSLYASGYTGKQLDSIFRTVDFDALLNDDLPREAKTFYERDNSERYAIALPFKNLKIELPSALSRGQNMYNLLSKLLIHVNEIKEFSQLPIPFLCVATNIENGEVVVLEKGQLAESVKASSALPTVYQPVYINGDKLIDGGIVNNYPVDELIERGMDFIIGVDVQDGLSKKEDVNSALEVLLQMSNFNVYGNMKEKVKKTDIYIKPNIKGYNLVSFAEGKQIEKRGEEATLELAEKIKILSALQNAKPKKPLDVKFLDSITINAIDIKGLENYTSAYVLGKLKLKSGEKMSYNDFEKGLNNLVATNNFDRFNYSLSASPGYEGYDLEANVKETNQTTFLKFGAHYDQLYKTAVLANFTKNQLMFSNDVLSLDFAIGEKFRYNFDYYIDKGFYWSIGLKSRFNQFDVSVANQANSDGDLVVVGVNKIGFKVQDLTNQFYLETLFRKDVSLRLGAEHKLYKIFTENLTSENDAKTYLENANYFSLFGGLKLDMYDSKYFPKTGVYFNSDLHWYFKSSNSFVLGDVTQFSVAKAELGYACKILDNLSVNVFNEAGFKINADENSSLDFILGGYGNELINNFKPFYGYDFASLSAKSVIKSTITLDYEVFKKNHIIAAANFANLEDDLYRTGNWFSSPDYSGYALGYSVETFLGPIEGKYTWSPEANTGIWFFNIGFWF